MKYIELTQGKHTMVDDEDYEWLSCYKWCTSNHSGTDYVINSKLEYMHRLILCPPYGMVCDHINHDGLDNQKENIRVCTSSENQINKKPQLGFTSKYKGVYWHIRNKWASLIKINQRGYHCGLYINEEDAALVYNLYAITIFGKYAYLNEVNCFKGKGVSCK